MSYASELAGIIADAVHSTHFEVVTLRDAIRAYMLYYERQKSSFWTMLNSYQDLIRFATDIEVNSTQFAADTV